MNSPESGPPKVFISYAWKNQTVARQLQHDLQRDGVEVFVDYEKISGGDSLPERISAALDWCNTLILLWSADSTESFYVKQEWTSAFHLQKRIIACVLDGADLPALLRGRLYLNFSSYETGYPQLCRSLGVEPKMATPTPAAPSALSPQHAEFPVGDQISPPSEVRENPPIAKQKPKLLPTKLAKKTKRWQPLLSKTAVGSLRGSAVARRVSAWWPRGKMMNITFVIILVAIIYIAFQLIQSSSKPVNLIASLRSEPDTLSIESVNVMLIKRDFYDAYLNENSKGITHQYKSKKSWIIFGEAVVIDYATGLTWQQSGSDSSMNLEAAQDYIQQLNAKRYGGYTNWRLPTLEEAMSLMVPKEYSDFYIDPKFDRSQVWIWTADKDSAGQAWYVDFDSGGCAHHAVGGDFYVRAVR